jgi:hypothetical protein
MMRKEAEKKTDLEARKPARRELLGSSALAAASLMLGLAAVACGDDGDAKHDDDEDAGGGGKSDAGTAALDADVEPLNALLTAEYKAIAAYTAGAGLIASAKAADPLYALRTVIKDVAVNIQSQHKLHAKALVDAIEELSGTPADEDEVAKTFAPPDALVANPSISNVLKFAAGAERAAAVAYNQVLAGLEDAKLRFLASCIEGDESQHFIVLTALVLGLAAPGAKLSSATADAVIPEAFVAKVSGYEGLDVSPPDYFG